MTTMAVPKHKSSNYSNRKLIRLIIEDFGPIEKADLEFGDFTAIIGPNSSGKTFIIKIIKKLMDTMSNSYMFIISRNISESIKSMFVKDKDIEYTVSVKMSEYPEKVIDEIVDSVIEKVENLETMQANDYKNIKAQFFQYFQTDPKNLIRFGKSRAKITAYFEQMEINIKISRNKDPSFEIVPVREFLINYIKGFTANFFGKGGASFGSTYTIPQMQSILVPTERLSVLVTLPNVIEDLAKSTGYQFLLPSLHQVQQRQDVNPSLMEFLSNYLSSINLLTMSKKEISQDASALIMGNLTLDISLPFFINFKMGENNLPLNLISSGTLQLIPLVVLSESNLGNNLLIEEPEINLHANKQVEVAEYLWKLVEERDRTIIVSTHSDYFVMKLAHLSKDNKNKVLRVYFLNDGRTVPLKISQNGEIEEIKSIGEVMNKLLLEV